MASRAINKFKNGLAALGHTSNRIERLRSEQQLALRDTELLYEGLFLRAVVAFEELLEARFYEVLRDHDGWVRGRWGGKINPASDLVMRDVVMEGKPYVNWLPLDVTLNRAHRYLYRGAPFCDFDSDDRSKLAQIVTIRNAVAHSSTFARAKFRDTVIGSANLLARERTPAGFLRSIARTEPTLRRCQIYLHALGKAAAKLRRSQ